MDDWLFFRPMDKDLIDNFGLTSKKTNYYVFLLVVLIIQFILFSGGISAAYIKFDTIVISAPLILLNSIALIILYGLSKNSLAFVNGLVSFLFVMINFAIIYFYELGPRPARKRLLFLMIVFTGFYLIFLAITLLLVNRKRRNLNTVSKIE